MLAPWRKVEIVLPCSHLVEDERILRSRPAQPPIPLSNAGIGATYISAQDAGDTGKCQHNQPAGTPIGAMYASISLCYFQLVRDIDNMPDFQTEESSWTNNRNPARHAGTS